MTRIVGVTGYKRSGKDSVAAVLTGSHGFKRVAFADPLKEMALAIDPYVEYVAGRHGGVFWRLSRVIDSEGWEAAKALPDVRRFLQRLGTEGVRDTLGPDAWLLCFRRALTGAADLVSAHHATVDPQLKVVIPDVRFPNEAAAIREMGGQVWKVTRPGCASDGHASEAGIDRISADYTLGNSGSLEDLAQVVKVLMS